MSIQGAASTPLCRPDLLLPAARAAPSCLPICISCLTDALPSLLNKPLGTQPSYTHSGAAPAADGDDDGAPAEPAAPRAAGGFGGKACVLSPELQAFLGAEAMPRTQVVKEIWRYIHEHGLQVRYCFVVVICCSCL